jgi:hypothetical protein
MAERKTRDPQPDAPPVQESRYTLRELQATFGDGLAGAFRLAGKKPGALVTPSEAAELLRAYREREVTD